MILAATGFAGALAAGFATAFAATGLAADLAVFLELAFLLFLFSGMWKVDGFKFMLASIH
jgi:hypothetical protein